MAVARGYDAVRQALPLRGAGALAITQEAWARPALRHTKQVRARSGSLIAREVRNGGR